MPLLHPLNYLVIILNEEPQYPLFGHVHVGSLKEKESLIFSVIVLIKSKTMITLI